MHLEIPLSVFELAPFPHSASRTIDWYIEEYYGREAQYNEMRFRFDELTGFIPGESRISLDNNKMIFDSTDDIKAFFPLFLDGVDANVSLINFSRFNHLLVAMPSAHTVSELRIAFPPTNNFKFLYKLYQVVNCTFDFICNRSNISLETADLLGSIETENGAQAMRSTLHVYDKYKEPPEESRIKANTISFAYLKNHFAELMQLMADYNSNNGVISLRGIHPSLQKRRLFDLRHSISVTSSFEHLVRAVLPEIHSEETIQTYEEIKALINDNYVLAVKGNKRKIAKSIIKHLQPEVSFSEKVKKAIKGYDEWAPLLPIVENHFNDWEKLADVINEWRNDVAHEKRKMSPSADIINAVRMIERLNYAIILRTAGYSDDEIVLILDKILDR